MIAKNQTNGLKVIKIVFIWFKKQELLSFVLAKWMRWREEIRRDEKRLMGNCPPWIFWSPIKQFDNLLIMDTLRLRPSPSLHAITISILFQLFFRTCWLRITKSEAWNEAWKSQRISRFFFLSFLEFNSFGTGNWHPPTSRVFWNKIFIVRKQRFKMEEYI